MFFSTINRNPKSYLFAVIGAEYLLGMLPRGTHDYARFIKPSELARWCRDAGLEPLELKGMTYNPVTDVYRLGDDCGVNYSLCCAKNAHSACRPVRLRRHARGHRGGPCRAR